MRTVDSHLDEHYKRYTDTLIRENDRLAAGQQKKMAEAAEQGKEYYEPTEKDVHIDAVLSNFSVRYVNEGYIADRVMPMVKVMKESDVYFAYTRADWLRDEARVRAPGAPAPITGWNVTSATYSAREWVVGTEVPDRVRDNTDAPLNTDRNAVGFVTEKLMLSYERRVANICTSGTQLGSYVSLSGTNKWSDYVNSDPISDVSTAAAFIKLQTGRAPNTMVMGYNVFLRLKQHPDIIERIKYTGIPDNNATLNAMRGIFDIPNLLIGGAVYDTAAEGVAASYSLIWGDNVLLEWVDPNPGIETMTFGVTFAVKDRQVRRGRVERELKSWYEAAHIVAETVVAQNAAYGILAAI